MKFGPTAQVAVFNAIGAGLGFVVLMILTRGLGAETFGRLAPALAIMDLGPLFIDTVLSAGTVTIASRRMAQDPTADGRDAMATALALRSAAALAYAFGICAVAVFLPDGSGPMIAMAGVAGALLALQTALIGGLQAEQRFVQVGMGQAFKNAFRVLLMGALLLAGMLSLTAAMQAALAAAGLALLATLVLARPGYANPAGHGRGRVRRDLAGQMLAINLWMAVAAVSVVSGRIDILLLNSLSGPTEAAYYAAGIQLCIVVGVVSQAIVATTLPRIAAVARTEDLRAMLDRWMRRAPLALLPVLVMPLISPFAIPLVLGEGFAEAHWAFDLLFASAMLTLVANPVMTLLFPLGAARIFGLTALGQVIVKVAISLIIIPWGGAAGVAAVDLLTRLVMAAIILVALRRRLATDGPITLDNAKVAA
ncbi:lipopolysaccharide biosynthesis protein [Rhodobacter ferrooxidans]|uniref:Polysaccharide biosynthesis protein n=1 Tax=Rhodobacter ferrooxidans TaxID=371731 RepID=C8S4A2_9RHOB|nr:oligosaccharide flippase family protein [Rhodobacter sp. SW2]EEW24161.1 polysaccharide biosynthesis protein [Rhodobacter sp. SW2]